MPAVPGVPQVDSVLVVDVGDLVSMTRGKPLGQRRLVRLRAARAYQYRLAVGELLTELVNELLVRAAFLVVVARRELQRLGWPTGELGEQFGAVTGVAALVQPDVAGRRVPGIAARVQILAGFWLRSWSQVWSMPAMAFSSTGAHAALVVVESANAG
jgi:hypothetical protein